MKAGDQAFRAHRPDLLGREINHGDNLSPHQRFRLIKVGDLRARFAQADIVAKIDFQLIRGFARLGKLFDLDDRTHAQLNFFEIGPVYSFQFHSS